MLITFRDENGKRSYGDAERKEVLEVLRNAVDFSVDEEEVFITEDSGEGGFEVCVNLKDFPKSIEITKFL